MQTTAFRAAHRASWFYALIPLLGVLLPTTAHATVYYVASAGSDADNGSSPDRAWKTLERVNIAKLLPGDKVLFRRGDTWRGSLRPRSGALGRPVTYGAYGDGPKPVLLGSVSRNSADDWRDEGESVWSTGGVSPEKPASLPPADAAEQAMRWSVYSENGAKASGNPVPDAASPAAFRVECADSGHALSDIQLSTVGLRLQQGQSYRLLIRARASQPFALTMPSLMCPDAPWTPYSSGPALRSRSVGNDWAILSQYYRANTTTDNARLTLYLGGILPAGASLEIDRFIFAECPDSEVPADGVLPVDVGNIIFDKEDSCGVKVWTRADLKVPGQFWYDAGERKLYLCSEKNPANLHNRIECALARHIIDESGVAHVTYENLTLKYGAAHGIGGGGTQHITVRGCDIAYIGGADQNGDGQRVRFGNGIEFWGSAHDNLVERCRLWEIYDAALTNQNMGGVAREYNITYRNNLIWNSEYSFEYWNRPGASETHNIQFISNTCVNAGHGWSHAQRPDPSGRHLCFYTSDARARDITIADNIFYEAATNAFYAPTWSREAIARLRIDYNLWYQKTGVMLAVCGRSYTMAQFAQYREEQGKEPHSIVADPRFKSLVGHDFHLLKGSPCIRAGWSVGLRTDFEGNLIPLGVAPDIGALQYRGRG
jgi:hypothetical protein